MKVGDYVRTEKGIAKITKIFSKEEEPYEDAKYQTDTYLEIYYDSEYIGDYYIIKSSPNIIDLIEENDLIGIEYKISTEDNQKEIVQVIKNVNNKLFIKTYTEHYVFIEDIEKTIYRIKSIITHEQIDSMEYEVKE